MKKLTVFVLTCLTGALGSAGIARAEIRVENIKPSATLRYPIAVLRGAATAADGTALPDGTPITISNPGSTRAEETYQTQVWNGHFVLLSQLMPGNYNALQINVAGQHQTFPLSYLPQTNPNILRVIYYTDAQGDTDYQTPDPHDLQNFKARASTTLKLLQTYMGEEFERAGYGRRSFALELDAQGEVVVHVAKTKQPDSYFFEGDPDPRDRIYRDVDTLLDKYPTEHARNLVFTNIYRTSTNQDGSKGWRGPGAVGSWYSGNAVFHTGNLWAMPATLQDVAKLTLNNRRVPRDLIYDDSGGRNTYWGAFGTGFGVLLHEMGHAWSLAHRDDAFTVMSRGFDQANRFFSPREPKSDGTFILSTPQNTSTYRLEQLQRLAYSQWFWVDAPPTTDVPPAKVTLDAPSDTLIFTAAAGLRVIGIDAERQFLRTPGDYSTFQNEGTYTVTNVRADQNFDAPLYAPRAYDGPNPPTRVEIGRAKLAHFVGTDAMTFVLVDGAGRISITDPTDLAQPRLFIRDWRVLPDAARWADSTRLPAEPSADELAQITARLRAQPLVRSQTAALDLGAFYGGDETTNEDKIAYVLATIDSPTARRVLLKTGSDDALRAWNNGVKVGEKYALRGVSPDSDVFPLDLRAGTNELVFEVANRNFGWSLIARLTSENAPANPNAIGVGGPSLEER